MGFFSSKKSKAKKAAAVQGPKTQEDAAAEAEKLRLRESEAEERRAEARVLVDAESKAAEAKARRVELGLAKGESKGLTGWDLGSKEGGGFGFTRSDADEDASLLAYEGDNGKSGDDAQSVGLKINEGGKKSIELSQAGLLSDADGNDHIGGVKLGEEGLEASGIHLANGWSVDFAAGPNQQKLAFNAPTELTFPPPDGLSLDFLPEAPYPLAPGLFVGASAGLEAQLQLSDIAIGAEHTRSKEGDDPYEQVSHWQLSGKGGFEASAGIKLEVVIIGGVPVVANVRLGVRAKAEAKVTTEFEVGGYLDFTQTVPVEKGQKPATLSTDGQIYFNVTGGGSIAAALSAFVGVEIMTFKGDLYELVIVNVPLANIDTGARFGIEYDNGDWSPFLTPTVGDKGIAFDWLLKRYFKVRKLDAAKHAATESKADITALKQLKKQADEEGVNVKDLVDSANFHAEDVVNGEVKELIIRRENLAKILVSQASGIADLEEALEGPLKVKNDAIKAKRWKATNFVRGDSSEYADAKKSLAAMRKSKIKNEAKLDGLGPKIQKAQAAFVKNLDAPAIDELIEAARYKKHETRRKNYELYTSELSHLKKTHHKQAKDVTSKIDDLTVRVEDMRTQIKAYEADDNETMAAYKQQLLACKREEDAAETLYLESQKLVEAQKTKVEGLATQHAEAKAKKSRLAKAFASEDKDLKSARADLKKLEAAGIKNESAHNAALSKRFRHGKANPHAALVRQLATMEGDLMTVEKRRIRIEDQFSEDQIGLTKLMLGEWTDEQRAAGSEERRAEKMAKYSTQYGKEGSVTKDLAEKKQAQIEASLIASGLM